MKINTGEKRMKTNVALIKLTARQKEIAEWAIDPMGDYFSELLREEEITEMPDLPKVEPRYAHDTHYLLELPLDPDVIGDLLYRITVQFIDITDEEQRGMVADVIVGEDGVARRNTSGINAALEQAKKARADATSARQLGRKIESVAKQNHIKYFVG